VHVRHWMITDNASFKIGEVRAGNPRPSFFYFT